MSRSTQTSVKAKDVLKIILEKADDRAINALISHTGLQFLYPYQGLQWVVYLGNGLAKCILDNSLGNISFDPNKIADIRYVEPKDSVKEDRLLAVGALKQVQEDLVSIMPEAKTIKKPLAKGLI